MWRLRYLFIVVYIIIGLVVAAGIAATRPLPMSES
jgi:hypothetical protein